MICQSRPTGSAKSYFTPTGQSALRRYVVAFGLFHAAAVLIALAAWLSSIPLVIIFIMAIASTQAYSGLGSGTLATAMAIAMSIYLFLPSYLSQATERDQPPLLLYFMLTLSVSFLYSVRTRGRIS